MADVNPEELKGIGLSREQYVQLRILIRATLPYRQWNDCSKAEQRDRKALEDYIFRLEEYFDKQSVAQAKVEPLIAELRIYPVAREACEEAADALKSYVSLEAALRRFCAAKNKDFRSVFGGNIAPITTKDVLSVLDARKKGGKEPSPCDCGHRPHWPSCSFSEKPRKGK